MNRLQELLTGGNSRQYPKGQIILYQGEKTSSVFRIVSGYVKVYDIDVKGNEKIILILGPNNIFPIISATANKDRFDYFYQSLSELELNVISRKKMQSHLQTNHQVALGMLNYYAQLTGDLFARIECIEATNAKHKVAQVLSYLAKQKTLNRRADSVIVEVPLTHQTIADLAGVVRETASMQLKEFESDGVIEWTKNKKLKIVEKKLNRVNKDS